MGVSDHIEQQTLTSSFNLKTDQELVGTKNRVNIEFSSPDEFILPTSSFSFLSVYKNGQKQINGVHYSVVQNLGKGSGIRFFRPPNPQDYLSIDYAVLKN